MPHKYVFKARYADRPAVGDDVIQALKTLVTNDHYADFHLSDYAGYTTSTPKSSTTAETRTAPASPTATRSRSGSSTPAKGHPSPNPTWTTFWARRVER